MEWMKPRIKPMIWNLRKEKKTFNQNCKNKKDSLQKNKVSLAKEPQGQLEMYQHLNHRDATRRREEARN